MFLVLQRIILMFNPFPQFGFYYIIQFHYFDFEVVRAICFGGFSGDLDNVDADQEYFMNILDLDDHRSAKDIW